MGVTWRIRLRAILLLAAWAVAPGSRAQVEVPPERQGEVPVDRPWFVCPSKPDRTLRYYPQKAMRREVEGSAVIQCRFRADSSPEACVWIRESEPDYDFGPTAERMGCQLRMRPEGEAAGKPFVGQIPLRFRLPR